MAKKTEERRKNQEAAGIPDSKPFISDEPVETGETRMLQCHIKGVLVSDLNLPPQVIAALDYWSTDEGIEERNANPNVRPPSGVELGRGEFEKSLDQRRHEVKDRDFPLYEARDPLKEVADRYVGPGFRPKFLRPNKVKEESTGDYEVVKYPEGHPRAGDPVRVKGMVLGQVPEEVAVARNAHYRKRGNDMLKQIGEQYLREGGKTAVADQ